jgi:hypothetical protein
VATEQVLTVRGEAELAARAGHLFATVRDEFLCAATDMNTWSQSRARPAISARMRAGITGGVAVRKLYTPAALAEGGQRRRLLEAAAAGAYVRICAARRPDEAIIIDRRVMIIAGPQGPAGREFTIATARPLLDEVLGRFEAAWTAAPGLAACLRRGLPQIGPADRALLDELTAGRTDEAAARRLGVSLRTYRRRVAALIQVLESDTRFQAALSTGERGRAASPRGCQRPGADRAHDQAMARAGGRGAPGRPVVLPGSPGRGRA